MNGTNNNFCQTKTYYAIASDPIHVGTGAYRLAGVDLTIMRDPATRLPKIPGSSLSGVARSNASMRLQDPPFKCAGKDGEKGDGHCGELNCAICNTFGFSLGSSESLQGMAQFFDAHILLSPAYSMYGTVWITSESIMREAGFDELPVLAAEEVALSKNFASKNQQPERINLGWLLLDGVGKAFDGSKAISALLQNVTPKEEKAIADRMITTANRLVVVHDNLFSRLVNDNLEIRTSVSINPKTGAAEEGALFSYEAIPRTTFMRFDVVHNDPRNFRGGAIKIAENGSDIEMTIDHVRQTVETGLLDFATFGIGGMNTRGMGRMDVLNLIRTS